MKILWVKTDFLHPTTRGGQIRTLEMLRQLHKRHEIHYVAFNDPAFPEGLRRSSEYCTHAYPIEQRIVPKQSLRFAGTLVAGLFSPIPVAGMRWRSAAMRETIARLLSEQSFDTKVCDFLFPSINIPDMRGWILFQHNVETIIWERHASAGRSPLHRAYFGIQARRMREWERTVCLQAAQVLTVSPIDEQLVRERFGVQNTSSVPTGVDVEYFERPANVTLSHDLVFVGSMDWMPNIDGVRWFFDEILPIIRRRKPECRVAIVGRRPPAHIAAEAKNPLTTITGTVPDVRPFLWESAVSIVPLRVGGGTRLKIFEAMAAGTPVVSTTIGAEGLPVRHGEEIRIADAPDRFAEECLRLLEDAEERRRMSAAGLDLIHSKFSWEQVTRQFEQSLRAVDASVSQTA
ncbi:MAG TPA: glycosyltransferase [Bryobacteraceae bacterium]|jgi:glycosyltransferase involved in cell wall biosynthesis|nr:glycosyltransferase [Bryobacteraceae bacterium]